jgi:hypothetical protein
MKLTKIYSSELIGSRALKPDKTISLMKVKLRFSNLLSTLSHSLLTYLWWRENARHIDGEMKSWCILRMLLCWSAMKIKKDSFESSVCVLSTDVELDNETILRYYTTRWTIKPSYQYLKDNLGLTSTK